MTSLTAAPVVLTRSTTSPEALKNGDDGEVTLTLITPATPVGLMMNAPWPSVKSVPRMVASTLVAAMRTTLVALWPVPSVICSNWKLPVIVNASNSSGWKPTSSPIAVNRT